MVTVLAQVDVAVVWLCSSLKSPQRNKGILPGLSTEEEKLCSHTVASAGVPLVTPSSQHLNDLQMRLSLP